MTKSAVLELETRSNSRKLLDEHPFQQRFLSIPQQFKLTLMKGDEVVETENDRRYVLLLAFRRVRDLNFGYVVAMDMYD